MCFYTIVTEFKEIELKFAREAVSSYDCCCIVLLLTSGISEATVSRRATKTHVGVQINQN